jgi:hypothetical protein
LRSVALEERPGSLENEGGSGKAEKLKVGRQIKERVALGAFHLKSASFEGENWYSAKGIVHGVKN